MTGIDLENSRYVMPLGRIHIERRSASENALLFFFN